MSFILIIFGLLCISTGQWSLQRGRGGKRTTNGIIIWLFGLVLLSSGLISILGQAGFLLILTIGILYQTPLRFWVFKKIKDFQKKISLSQSKADYCTYNGEETSHLEIKEKDLTNREFLESHIDNPKSTKSLIIPDVSNSSTYSDIFLEKQELLHESLSLIHI